jgi:MarC family membrane protein
MAHLLPIALTFFFVIDAFGVIPPYLSLVKQCKKKRRMTIALRELFIALFIMLLFYFVGKGVLSFLSLTHDTVQIAGAITLFLIAIRLIFSSEDSKPDSIWGEKEPFIVPLATPLIAGPSLLATIMIYSEEEPTMIVMGAILLAWAASGIIFLLAHPIFRLFGAKGLMACQRLMGLIVGLIAVQNFLKGMGAFMSHTS